MANVSNIQTVDISELIPYENNAKIHDKKQIEKLKESIKKFGFLTPVLIDKDKNIIAGHGRTKAAKELGLKELPCVCVEGLSEDEKRAYIIADNRLAEFGKWDKKLVNLELSKLKTIKLDDCKFELPKPREWYGDERERTYNYYNLRIALNTEHTSDFWQMPVIKKSNYIPDRLIGFNYALSSEDKETGLHCFVDDYQFERLWNAPDKYIETLKEYKCFLSPDFSLYTDMSEPMRIWNTYRSRLIGAYYQRQGIEVIPTISWAQKSSFKYCFKGIEGGGVVAVSTIGVKDSKDAFKIWSDGMKEMIKQIEPSMILVYGGEVEFDYKGIIVRYYDNEVTRRWSDD